MSSSQQTNATQIHRFESFLGVGRSTLSRAVLGVALLVLALAGVAYSQEYFDRHAAEQSVRAEFRARRESLDSRYRYQRDNLRTNYQETRDHLNVALQVARRQRVGGYNPRVAELQETLRRHTERYHERERCLREDYQQQRKELDAALNRELAEIRQLDRESRAYQEFERESGRRYEEYQLPFYFPFR